VQTPTSLSDGNAVPQASSSSSLKPPAAGSSLKVTGQVLSRAALEISQAPTMSLAASLGAGACAPAPAADSASAITATHARAGMGENPKRIAVGRTLSRRARRVMPRAPADSVASPAYAEFTRAHDRFVFGGHGVSATGVSGGLPAAHAKRLSTTSWSILSRVATDAEPRWGNSTTLSMARSSAGT